MSSSANALLSLTIIIVALGIAGGRSSQLSGPTTFTPHSQILVMKDVISIGTPELFGEP